MATNRSQSASTDKQAPPFSGGVYREENSNVAQSGKKRKSPVHNAIQNAKNSTRKSKL